MCEQRTVGGYKIFVALRLGIMVCCVDAAGIAAESYGLLYDPIKSGLGLVKF